MKRILLITNGYPFGESERSFLGDEVQEIMKSFELYVMAPDNGEKLLYPVDGIRQIRRYSFTSFGTKKSAGMYLRVFAPSTVAEALRFVHKNHFTNVIGDTKEILLYRYHVWEVEQMIEDMVAQEKIDIVYTYWCTDCTLAALRVKRRFPSLKVITRFHGYDLYVERTRFGWHPFRKELTDKADGLIFACEAGRQYYISHWGVGRSDRTRVSYLGSKQLLRMPRNYCDSLRLISCSNMIPLKRIELIIDALALLPEEVNVEWNHFGDGSERHVLEQRAVQKLSAKGNIHWNFHGYVCNCELPQKYRELDAALFITTSSTEGVPVSIMEAAAMGIPAIGTAVGGIPEIISDGETGFLLPANPTKEEISEAILKFYAMPQQQRDTMSDSAMALWQEYFDARKNAEQFVEYLQTLARQ